MRSVSTIRTPSSGGLFLGGLSLWLLLGGLAARAAGSNRLWRLLRRRDD